MTDRIASTDISDHRKEQHQNASTRPGNGPIADLVERILAEGPIGFGVAARLMGSFGIKNGIHPSTVARWHKSGFRANGGLIVRLDAIKLSGRYATSKPAILRFLKALQSPDSPQSTIPTRTLSQRELAIDAADIELRKLRIS